MAGGLEEGWVSTAYDFKKAATLRCPNHRIAIAAISNRNQIAQFEIVGWPILGSSTRTSFWQLRANQQQLPDN